jgi:predicted nucleotidyltransferase
MIPLEKAHNLNESDRDLLRHVKEIVVSLVPGAQVFLYGSVARGEAGPESDYDILALTPDKLSTPEEDRVYDAVYELEVAQDVVISVVFYTLDEWNTDTIKASPHYRNVTREGIAV